MNGRPGLICSGLKVVAPSTGTVCAEWPHPSDRLPSTFQSMRRLLAPDQGRKRSGHIFMLPAGPLCEKCATVEWVQFGNWSTLQKQVQRSNQIAVKTSGIQELTYGPFWASTSIVGTPKWAELGIKRGLYFLRLKHLHHRNGSYVYRPEMFGMWILGRLYASDSS